MNKTLIVVLSLNLLTLGCKNGLKNKREVLKKDNLTHENVCKEDYLNGKWRIDSIAANNVVISRTEVTDTVFQGFEFDCSHDRVLMVKSRHFGEEARPLGNYEVIGDSILFKSVETRNILQRYSINRVSKTRVELHGNFFFNESHRKKPTFYLTKIKRIDFLKETVK